MDRPTWIRLCLCGAALWLLALAAPPAASAQCPCSTAPAFDNFCDHPPSTQGCAMTQPGGYCDPNGDSSYTDGDWNRGYYEYHGQYPAGCGGGGGGCRCDNGVNSQGNPIDPASTYCGYRVCGADDQFYECTAAGWDPQGGSCGGPAGCRCEGGSDFWGQPVDPDATSCGFQVCGGDDQLYECTAAGWDPIGGSPCSGSGCRCHFGVDANGNPIDPASTYCGYRVCGADDQFYECTASGWDPQGGPCSGSTAALDCFGLTINPNGGGAQSPEPAEFPRLGVRWVRSLVENGRYVVVRTLAQRLRGLSEGVPRILVIFNQQSYDQGSCTVANGQVSGCTWQQYVGNYVTALTAFLQAHGTEVDAVQIFNETNQDPGDVSRTVVTAAQFADLVRAATPVIRNHGLFAITGGLARGEGTYEWDTYLPAFLTALGTGDHYDGLGFHAYSLRIDGFGRCYGGEPMMEDVLNQAHAFQTGAGRPAPRPLWITEFGAKTSCASGICIGCLSPAEAQAQYLSEVYQLFGSLGPEKVAHGFWFAWSDHVEQLHASDGYGLVDPQLNPRLSWEAYRLCATSNCPADVTTLTQPAARPQQCPCAHYLEMANATDVFDNTCFLPLNYPLCPATSVNVQGANGWACSNTGDWTNGGQAYRNACQGQLPWLP